VAAGAIRDRQLMPKREDLYVQRCA